MARIQEYTQQTSATAEIGGRRAQDGDVFAIGPEVGRAVGRVADVMEDAANRQEVSDVQAQLAKARAEWTVALQERAQSMTPGDATFAPKFNEEFGKHIAGLGDKLQTRAGQQAFQRGSAELAAHFVEKTGIFQARAMGEKAVQDYSVSLNARRSELLSDPTQFQPLLQAALADLNDPDGTYAKMPAAEREKLKIATQQELALSAVQGLIQNGAPELAKRQLQDGKWDSYLDADKKAALTDRAEVGIRAKDSEAERKRQLEEREKRDRQDNTMRTYLARIIDPKANGGALSDREILANPDLTAGQMQHAIDYKRARARELSEGAENRNNPNEVRRLLGGIIASGEDPSKAFTLEEVNTSYRAGKISTREWSFLSGQFDRYKDGATNSFARDVNSRVGAIEGQIRGSLFFMNSPEKAIDSTNRLRYDLEARIQEMRTEKKNPRDLLNPQSKDYFFSEGNLATYFRPLKDEVRDQAEAARRKGTTTPAGAVTSKPAATNYPSATNAQGEKIIFKDGKWQKP